MTKTQRENLAKYCYDISKLMFGAFVLANIMSDNFSVMLTFFGFGGMIFFIFAGLYLNHKE